MTICVSVKYKNRTVIGADSLISAGDRKEVNVDSSKIIEFKNFYVLWSGSVGVFSVLNHMSKSRYYNKKIYMKMENLTDATEFCKDVFKRFKQKISCIPDGAHAEDPEEREQDESIELIIATPSNMFSTGPYLEVMEFNRFVCVGSGSDLAIGALEVLFPRIRSEDKLEDVVKKVLNIVIRNSSACGKPIVIRELLDE